MNGSVRTTEPACTAPDRWRERPGASAGEREVEEYLAHAETCPLHAAIERREEDRLRALGAVAHGAAVDAAGIGADPARAARPAKDGVVGSILVLVDGVESARLTRGDTAALDVEPSTLVTLRTPDREFLGGWFVAEAAGFAAPTRLEPISLPGRERVCARVVAREGEVRITLARERTGLARLLPALPHSFGGVLRPALAGAIAAAVVAIAAVAIVGPWSAPREVGGVEAHPPPPPSATDVSPPNGTVEPPTAAQPPDTEPPRASSNPPRNTPPAPRSRPAPPVRPATIASIRSVYVASEGADPAVRAAVERELVASGRFEVVDSPAKAEAVLRLGRTRGAGVTGRLVSRDERLLWYRTSAPSPDASEEEAASSLARALADEARAARP